jgi:heavy metal sensor kinase
MKKWWQRQTIRFRLATWYTVIGTVLITAFSAVIYLYIQHRALNFMYADLRGDLRGALNKLSVRADGSATWNNRKIAPNYAWEWYRPWIEVWDEKGRLIRRLWPLSDSQIEQYPFAPPAGRETIAVFNVAKDLRLQAISVPYGSPTGGEPWMIRVMQIDNSASDVLGSLHMVIVTILPLVVGLLVLSGYSMTGRWLRPLQNMVAEANCITASDLNFRLTVANRHDEVGRVASVFNDTLDRLQNSFVALDRFVADASHELRTPVTALRNVGETALKGNRSIQEYREAIGSMLEEARRLQMLIERLLELASVEAERLPVHRRPIQLDECAAACVDELRILAENKSQRILLTTVKCIAHTDPILFWQSLQNLLDNAIKYSPVGATIQIAVESLDGSCRVTVADDGPGIAPEHRPHLTERFFRPDGSRDRAKGGFGLGLAITMAYAHVLGGSLRYEPVSPRGSSFQLILPEGRPPAVDWRIH